VPDDAQNLHFHERVVPLELLEQVIRKLLARVHIVEGGLGYLSEQIARGGHVI